MDWDDLRTFLAIARHGTLSAAARALGVTQPTMGRRLTAMEMIEILDRYHGQVTGMFSGDECLAGKNPLQGSELCAVVEYMYSLEILTSTFGDGAFADRLERLAYNALPATFAPDMWSHQYVQQVNQVQCTINAEHVVNAGGLWAREVGRLVGLRARWKLAAQVIAAFGGPANLVNVDACITRLRIEVADKSLVNQDRLKSLGAAGVIEVGNSVQAVFGTDAEAIKNDIIEIL